MKEYVIPNKLMYACKDGKQFITSFPSKRIKGGMSFECSDGVWVRPFMKDLRYKEGEVTVNLVVTLKRRPHSHRMWLFGAKKHRRLLEYEPIFLEEAGGWHRKGGAVWCAFWCDNEYFPDLEEDENPIEVFVTAERV